MTKSEKNEAAIFSRSFVHDTPSFFLSTPVKSGNCVSETIDQTPTSQSPGKWRYCSNPIQCYPASQTTLDVVNVVVTDIVAPTLC